MSKSILFAKRHLRRQVESEPIVRSEPKRISKIIIPGWTHESIEGIVSLARGRLKTFIKVNIGAATIFFATLHFPERKIVHQKILGRDLFYLV